VDVLAPEKLPALPAAVEVAAYRIVQEALVSITGGEVPLVAGNHAQRSPAIVLSWSTGGDLTSKASSFR
jgi:hypothetical protein